MNTPTWVLDTNVVVSALLCATGPPARLIDAVLDERLRLAFDDRMEAEYREVLARPRLAISEQRREAFLALLTIQESVLARPWTGQPLPDPDDLPFVEVAMQTPDKTLVTGNLRHCAITKDIGVSQPSFLPAWRRPRWT